MAKTPRRRLKVFGAQFGFHDTVVAAPSQKAALEAWGTRQNLFAEGRAKIIDDPDAVAAALAYPQIPLRRAMGSKEPFSLEPGLPDVPETPKPDTSKPKKADLKLVPKARARPPERPPPDRSELTAAEKTLAAINQRRRDEEAGFQARREALDREETASRQRWSRDRKAAEAALDKARRTFRQAGGET